MTQCPDICSNVTYILIQVYNLTNFSGQNMLFFFGVYYRTWSSFLKDVESVSNIHKQKTSESGKIHTENAITQ